jgi:hypothetical protein
MDRARERTVTADQIKNCKPVLVANDSSPSIKHERTGSLPTAMTKEKSAAHQQHPAAPGCGSCRV